MKCFLKDRKRIDEALIEFIRESDRGVMLSSIHLTSPNFEDTKDFFTESQKTHQIPKVV